MIGGISGVGAGYFNPYTFGYNRSALGAGQTAQAAQSAQNVQRPSLVRTAQRAANPETPVQPVRPAPAVSADGANPTGLGLPIREGADPVEMAVRMRIQYPDSQSPAQSAPGAVSADGGAEPSALSGTPARQGADLPALKNAAQALGQEDASVEDGEETKSAQEVAEEAECQTCKERKYQDGSDDPGVSFKTPTNIDPSQAASAVRGHEMEHVTREQAKAQREDRKVVSQSVTYHTAICPECGKAYVAGGTTRTVTKANNDAQQQDASQEDQAQRQPFSAIA